MKQQLLEHLHNIISSSTSIKLHVDKIRELRERLEILEDFTDIDRIELNSFIKSKVQMEASSALDMNRGSGLILMATGTGKSKLVIDRISTRPSSVRLIVVPTVKLRDVTWKEEFYKWNKRDEWVNTRIICYDSLASLEGLEFDTVYLDEGHNITEANSVFFEKNLVHTIVVLTATEPTNFVKVEIFRKLNINLTYQITLDEAVGLGLIAPYDITIVTTCLNETDRYLKAGNKAKSWLQTEGDAYRYISSRIRDKDKTRPLDRITRMHLLANLKSKLDATKYILSLIPQELRTLVFAANIEHARELGPYRYHSKPNVKAKDSEEKKARIEQIRAEYVKDAHLIEFMNGDIDRLICVEALNEGQNIQMLDVGLIEKLNSKELDFIQRMGRVLRFRPGHIGKVIIVGVRDTVDMSWIFSAMMKIDPNNVRTITLEDLKAGKEVISFI